MVINTNLSSLTAQRHLASSRADMETAMERLSSGKRINSAMDDAAGLTIAHNMSAQVTSLNQATRNANDGIAMINLAEGAMDQVSSMLERMKELATQSANGTYNQTDRDNLNAEFTALKNEITRIGEATTYNGSTMMNANTSVNFQIGDKGDSNNRLSVDLKDMRSTAIGSGADTLVKFATMTPVTNPAANDNHDLTFQIDATMVAAGDVLSITFNGTEYRQAVDTEGVNVADKVNNTITALVNQFTAVEGVQVSAVGAAKGDADDGALGGTHNVGQIKFEAYSKANAADINGVEMDISQLKAVTPGGNLNGAYINSQSTAQAALGSINDAMTDVDTYRANLGAAANRLEHTVGNLMTRTQNTSAAMSRIMDTDYATESANLAKQQVLQQAGTAMLAQANASTQNVLSLLK